MYIMDYISKTIHMQFWSKYPDQNIEFFFQVH